MDTIAEVMVGETLSLRILGSDDHWFEVRGAVTHHFPRLGFGVRFVSLNEEQHRQIGSLLPNIKPAPPASDDSGEFDSPSQVGQTNFPFHHINLSGVM